MAQTPPFQEEGRPRPRPKKEDSPSRFAKWRRLIATPWFDALVTVLTIVIILGALLLYSGLWPPLVVVESSSMQHGPNDVVGVINAGDIVLVKETDVPAGITTYVEGEVSGYETYGEHGDVILYEKNGVNGTTPVIHRAILWLDYNAAEKAFNAPSLLPLTCGRTAEYYLAPTVAGPTCVGNATQPLDGTIVLNKVGWDGVTVQIDLTFLLTHSAWSGFVTMGDDNNGIYDETPTGDGCAISCLVRASWVEGVARGMVPWLGAVKLLADGNSGFVPSQSWGYLLVSLLVILVLPQAVPWAYHQWRHRPGDRQSPVDSDPDGGRNDGDPPPSP